MEDKECKIAVISDLHLPDVPHSMQHAALSVALSHVQDNKFDKIIFAGDVTANSAPVSLDDFYRAIHAVSQPVSVLYGNSDRRQPNHLTDQRAVKTVFGRFCILCLDTSKACILEKDMALLEQVRDDTVIFMHHGFEALDPQDRMRLIAIARKKRLWFFHAHTHRQTHRRIKDTSICSLPAADPDKAIGEPPGYVCITLNDQGVHVTKRPIRLPLPRSEEIEPFFGSSCKDEPINASYRNVEIEYGNRMDALGTMAQKIRCWRKQGGRILAMRCNFGAVDAPNVQAWVRSIMQSGANMIVLPLPSSTCERTASNLADVFRMLPQSITVAVENRRSTPPDDPIAYSGCTPQACMEWIDMLQSACRERRIGFMLDVGAARYNPPHHKTIPLAVWYAHMGRMTVAYRLSQVVHTSQTGSMGRVRIDCGYGPLINYYGFFAAWQSGLINRKTIFFETERLCDVHVSAQSVRSMLQLHVCDRILESK